MTGLHAFSTLVLVLVGLGLYFRRRARIHLAFMVAALVVDLGLVLYIELTRSAVEKVTTAPLGAVLTFHIVASVLVLLIYLVQVGLGVRKLRSGVSSHLAHRYLGMAFVVLRLANYATSYMISSPEPTYAQVEDLDQPAEHASLLMAGVGRP